MKLCRSHAEIESNYPAILSGGPLFLSLSYLLQHGNLVMLAIIGWAITALHDLEGRLLD
jgi:hypothetical protein